MSSVQVAGAAVSDWRVVQGDCREVLRTSQVQAYVVITDPPWPGHEHIGLPGGSAEECEPLWRDFGTMLPTVCRRAIIILSNLTDPRILQHVPSSMPFLTTVRLRIIPPRYRGNLLYAADIAYVFGAGFISVPGTRVLPTEHTCKPSQGRRDPSTTHPCYRTQSGMDYLVGHFTKPGMTVLDPFCGSGNIGIAAVKQERNFIGIEIDSRYVVEARRRIELASRQGHLL